MTLTRRGIRSSMKVCFTIMGPVRLLKRRCSIGDKHMPTLTNLARTYHVAIPFFMTGVINNKSLKKIILSTFSQREINIKYVHKNMIFKRLRQIPHNKFLYMNIFKTVRIQSVMHSGIFIILITKYIRRSIKWR